LTGFAAPFSAILYYRAAEWREKRFAPSHLTARYTVRAVAGEPLSLEKCVKRTDIAKAPTWRMRSLFEMANWSDPWATAARTTNVDARGAAYDAGLRSYMLSVYNYMASGVLLTGVVALLFANSPYMSLLFSPQGRPSGLGYVVMFAPLGVVLWLSFGINRISETTAKACSGPMRC
jgi:hypothetical protein